MFLNCIDGMELSTFCLFIYICLQDLDNQIIQDRFFILLYIDLHLNYSYRIEYPWMSLIFFFILAICYAKSFLGGADIKYIVYAYVFLGFTHMLYMLMIANTCGLFYMYISNKKRIPFLPFLVLGTLILFYL
ncbi:Flp pilus assembly protein protease CpaA [Breznakia sp. PH1-1]|nr:Flp pilus assembly protein protease CpaA [Breznakia sp. PH1-1]MDH6404862.1 Flp pilus assembly protein protease CpaA [Breznakia sp. PF1-11]MDH6412577.1 Flp pilus assembly protein protease CpaA [Breznakia sp. PFB1-11]MDH6414947.1 Flp pilus assembly protein protease CpaA [Breznakia sp. PFB1-14]MDH6417258.1 Flp pilus assembly protein protease CpaA [Breznakia sp. PFB1-4]MDH6419610.1 Flp pilus assembly protein protease CpaA [Breznakia sp. PFB1-12]MDH6474652.1 Flp pilus assembly protein protease 